MIINFACTTVHHITRETTYWFTIQLKGYECTAIDVGFDQNGNLTSASGSFYNMEESKQKEIIEATAKMVPMVV